VDSRPPVERSCVRSPHGAYHQWLEKGAAQLATPVGGLDGLDHGIVGVVLTEPHAAAHPRIAGQGPLCLATDVVAAGLLMLAGHTNLEARGVTRW
jgi:hypothetical protein